ncbi:9200_t:CDS:10 [Paraglomus occultum]|uniref:Ubiquitin carboxyl-terminal hydrolase n=1 Tax=Paraglomus occultum TaxID=144539 RepID=A0A9N9CVM6_9GLOM|nr:9200_t:CDS:10 [Paraglomus occultum]
MNKTHGCRHIKKYKEDTPGAYLDRYRVVAKASSRWKNHIPPLIELTDRKSERVPPTPPPCDLCGDFGNRLHGCLHCSWFGCWPKHMKGHLVDEHVFAVDVERLFVYCSQCKDYIYDAEFLYIRELEDTHAQEDEANAKEPCAKRARFEEWQPSESEIAQLKARTEHHPCAGIRGLYNIGSTCYMNAVLQALINNPIVRAYFLADKHNRHLCEIGSHCLCCQLDILFQEMVSGSIEPYAPCSFLHVMWQNLRNSAGLEACYFLYLLNSYSTRNAVILLTVPPPLSTERSEFECHCVVHKAFGGWFENVVECTCGNANRKPEPMQFVQLHLPQVPKRGRSRKKSSEKAEPLVDCLRKFTAAERIDDYKCDFCNARETATTQFTIRQLPPVLSLVLERFQRSAGKTQKNETPVSFAEELDMREYTSWGKESLKQGKPLDCLPEFKYNLFAVVTHEGTYQSGHYKTYTRTANKWYEFDDSVVTTLTLEDVLNLTTEAYMLFYVKETLDYNTPRARTRTR